MSSIERSTGDTDEAPHTRECYRCDRNVAREFLFTIEVAPPTPLSEKYADSVRYCCEDCAAGMNLSDFSKRRSGTARQGSETSNG